MEFFCKVMIHETIASQKFINLIFSKGEGKLMPKYSIHAIPP